MSGIFWDELSSDNQERLLHHNNAGFGIVLNPSESWSVSYGTKLVELHPEQFAATYPSESGKFHTEVLETQAEFNMRNFGLTKVSVNAGLSGTLEGITGGISGSASDSVEKEHSIEERKTTYYLYSEFAVETVKLILQDKMPALDPSFATELQEVLENHHHGVQKLTDVYRLLNKKGWYVPTALTLGGKLIQTETVRTSKTTEKSRIREEFEAEFKATVGIPEAFGFEEGGSAKIDRERESSRTHFESDSGASRDVVGGSAQGLRHDGLEAWIASLEEDPRLWKVIGFELLPTLSFVPAVLLNDLRKLHNEYGSYEAARRHANIDAFRYFSEVELSTDGGLGNEDW